MADFTPAPKPSQKATGSRTTKGTSAKGGAVAKADDVKEGTPTYTPEFLRDNAKKRKELLAAPDGTPGKDVAVRVEAAAPLIAAGVKAAKEWDTLHGKAAQVTKSLAETLVRLRMIYADKDGKPDMRGQSSEYREAASLIYERAGFDTGKAQTVQGAVRYHISTVRNEIMRTELAGGDEKKYLELCEYYRLNPESAADRQKNKRTSAIEGGTRLPALNLPPDDTSTLWQGAVKYAHKALEAPGDADPTSLPDEEREALRKELESIRDRAETILDLLGVADDDADPDDDA